MVSHSKDDILNRIDRQYLERVSDSVNNSVRTEPRSYNEDDFNQYIRNKFSTDDLVAIWQEYMLCNPPESPARRIKDRSASELIDIYKSENIEDEFFVEHRVAGMSCDLVQVKDNDNYLVAIEVKSNGDDLRKAESQCQKYSKWANQVYLLGEPEKSKKALEELSSWIGVLNINDNGLTTERIPDEHHHSVSDLLSLMTVSQLKRILKSVDRELGGRKDALLNRAEDAQEEISIADVRRAIVSG